MGEFDDFDAEQAAYEAWWRTVPDAEKIKILRRRRVAFCLKVRKATGPRPLSEADRRFILKRGQKMLLQLRIWRATGFCPSLDN